MFHSASCWKANWEFVLLELIGLESAQIGETFFIGHAAANDSAMVAAEMNML